MHNQSQYKRAYKQPSKHNKGEDIHWLFCVKMNPVNFTFLSDCIHNNTANNKGLESLEGFTFSKKHIVD